MDEIVIHGRILKSCIHKYMYTKKHGSVYKETWEAVVGEDLDCERESNNARDCYNITMSKN